jgi:hypothetical protein
MMQRCRGARTHATIFVRRRQPAPTPTRAQRSASVPCYIFLLSLKTFSAESMLRRVRTFMAHEAQKRTAWCLVPASCSVPRSLARRACLSSLPAYCSCDHVAANAAGMPPFQNILCAERCLGQLQGEGAIQVQVRGGASPSIPRFASA